MGGLDDMFDIADDILDKADKTLPPSKRELAEAAENPNHESWEAGFEQVFWSPAGYGEQDPKPWHAFKESALRSVCNEVGAEATTGPGRQVLEHGKFITACTSCIIGVSK